MWVVQLSPLLHVENIQVCTNLASTTQQLTQLKHNSNFNEYTIFALVIILSENAKLARIVKNQNDKSKIIL